MIFWLVFLGDGCIAIGYFAPEAQSTFGAFGPFAVIARAGRGRRGRGKGKEGGGKEKEGGGKGKERRRRGGRRGRGKGKEKGKGEGGGGRAVALGRPFGLGALLFSCWGLAFSWKFVPLPFDGLAWPFSFLFHQYFHCNQIPLSGIPSYTLTIYASSHSTRTGGLRYY